jgi:hypothetical protein
MKTLNIDNYEVNGVSTFSRKGLQSVMGISARKYWREYLLSCGFNPDDRNAKYTEADGILLLTLKLFLRAKRGKKGHTINQFKQVVANNLVSQLCETFNLEPSQKWRELINEYQSRKI